MRGLSVWIGFKQDYVLYSREKRHSGVTHYPIFGKGPAVEFIRGLTAYSTTPLYMSFFIGLFASFVAVMIILFAVVTKLIGISAAGASSTLIAIAFFGGLILMSNGVLGIYISKIYYETTGRPRYIIESIIKPDDHE
jgi:dolichol-phosphate mannosyltransferase